MTDFERIQSDNSSTFLAQLRNESGHSNGCPVCGSGAWSHEDAVYGYCQDCGFDLMTATAFSYAGDRRLPVTITDHDPGDENEQHRSAR